MFAFSREVLAMSRISRTFFINSELFSLPIRIFPSTSDTTVEISLIPASTCSTVWLIVSVCLANCSVVAAFSPTHCIKISEESDIFSAEEFNESEHFSSFVTIYSNESFNESNAVAICPTSLFALRYFCKRGSLEILRLFNAKRSFVT